jgi:hypothetical protein
VKVLSHEIFSNFLMKTKLIAFLGANGLYFIDNSLFAKKLGIFTIFS